MPVVRHGSDWSLSSVRTCENARGASFSAISWRFKLLPPPRPSKLPGLPPVATHVTMPAEAASLVQSIFQRMEKVSRIKRILTTLDYAKMIKHGIIYVDDSLCVAWWYMFRSWQTKRSYTSNTSTLSITFTSKMEHKLSHNFPEVSLVYSTTQYLGMGHTGPQWAKGWPRDTISAEENSLPLRATRPIRALGKRLGAQGLPAERLCRCYLKKRGLRYYIYTLWSGNLDFLGFWNHTRVMTPRIGKNQGFDHNPEMTLHAGPLEIMIGVSNQMLAQRWAQDVKSSKQKCGYGETYNII